MNVNEFKSQMKGGGARPNLFKIELAFPLFAGGRTEAEKFTFMCKSAQIPAQTVGSIPVPYLGRQIPFPGDRTFAEWSISVFNDTDFKVRDAFEKWHNAINAHEDNTGLPFSELLVDAQIKQLDRDGSVLKTYRMNAAFPTEVGAIDLAWDANDAIEEFPVTFAYTFWSAATTS